MKALRRVMEVVVTLLLLVTLVVVGDNWLRFAWMDLSQNDTPNQEVSPERKADQIAQGEYLARIGGCVACHTPEGSALMAGARAIETPFGRVFSSNLTPSRVHGIGMWTSSAFWDALQWGRAPSGRLLIPAFPYNHTHVFTRSDSDTIWAWLQTLPAVEQANQPAQLPWPLSTQPALAVWRTLFFSPREWTASRQASPIEQRGAYLVQGPLHCAACHAPRNALGGFAPVDDYSGARLWPSRWLAPSLTDPTQTWLGTDTTQDIAQWLRSGVSEHAAAKGPMSTYIKDVTQYLTPEDALAVATYLKSNLQMPTMAKTPTQVNASNQAWLDAGQAVYSQHCESCHGQQGQGQNAQYPALAQNPSVNQTQPDNLIQVTLFGGFAPSTSLHPRPWGMPPFIFNLKNEEIAQVLSFVRASWGNQAPAVTAVEVDKMRGLAR